VIRTWDDVIDALTVLKPHVPPGTYYDSDSKRIAIWFNDRAAAIEATAALTRLTEVDSDMPHTTLWVGLAAGVPVHIYHYDFGTKEEAA
jgi:hypothetical protein